MDKKPRKLYKRRGIIHACVSGTLWSHPGSSQFDHTKTVVIENVSDTSLKLTQEVNGVPITETWTVCLELSNGQTNGQTKTQKKDPKPSNDDGEPRAEPLGQASGYVVFVPPMMNCKGIEKIKKIEDAPKTCVPYLSQISKDDWDDCEWGTIHSRYDLKRVGRVTHTGELEK